jgi:hypothetical protein
MMLDLAKRLWDRVHLYPKQPAEPELLSGKPRPMTSFFASLTDEQKARALAYRGEENHGDPKYSLRKMPAH